MTFSKKKVTFGSQKWPFVLKSDFFFTGSENEKKGHFWVTKVLKNYLFLGLKKYWTFFLKWKSITFCSIRQSIISSAVNFLLNGPLRNTPKIGPNLNTTIYNLRCQKPSWKLNTKKATVKFLAFTSNHCKKTLFSLNPCKSVSKLVFSFGFKRQTEKAGLYANKFTTSHTEFVGADYTQIHLRPLTLNFYSHKSISHSLKLYQKSL